LDVRTPGAANLVTLLDAVEALCPSVAAHGRRVSTFAVRLASQYGLAAPVIESIRVGALLHDIGKIQVPAHILAKPGRLTEREWVKLRTHPEIGCDLVERMGFDAPVCDIVLQHHERYDGSGYPYRLPGSAISWAVRLVSVADAFDAMTSDRAYREALSLDAARALLGREAGSLYCPWAVTGLLSLPRELLAPRASDLGPSFLPDGCPAPAATAATRAWQATLS
jgi:putative nucleotidyltransferase with HDIG domain